MQPASRSRIGTQIPVRANLWLAAVFSTVNLGAVLALPLWLMPRDPAWALLLVPAVLATPSFWSLTHEAVHGVFHPSPRLNVLAGRFLAWQFGAPFRVLRLGHLVHHRVSRTPMDRMEAFAPGSQSWLSCAAKYYYTLFIGLYLTELSALVLCWVPRPALAPLVRFLFRPRGPGSPDVRDWAETQLVGRRNFWELRIDTTMILVLYGTGLWLYGAAWPLLAAFILGRGFLISFLDNVYHYGTPLDQVRYSYNLSLPGWASRAMLNFNHHRVHHCFPGVPWRDLPAVHAERDGGFEHGFAAAALRQLKGPIRIDRLPGPVTQG